MDKDQIIEIFISDIKSKFPEVGVLIDQRMVSLEIEPELKMYTEMFECFSQATTEAIKVKDSATASKYLSYMSNRLKNASEIEKEYIDVYYTESLMWDVKNRKIKSWGWKLFPPNIKKLYEDMWGEQNL